MITIIMMKMLSEKLPFSKVADDYYIICNNRVDGAIDSQRSKKFNLYYMDISEAEVDGNCYISSVNEKINIFNAS